MSHCSIACLHLAAIGRQRRALLCTARRGYCERGPLCAARQRRGGTGRAERTETPGAGICQPASPRARLNAKRTAALFSLKEAIALPESVDTRHVFAGPGATR